MTFKEIYLIGEGRVAKECSKIATYFLKKEIIFISQKDKSKLDIFFTKIQNYFIISVNNFYIFKRECVESNFIINYHNSLLLKYKGRNAHIWAIWEDEIVTGITWHKVDHNIDTEDIILQKEIKINKSFTAIKLLQIQQNLAINSFRECLANVKNLILNPKLILYPWGGGFIK
ncbi:formyltransferase family protein [Campylobacter armoricus]|uniref:formyltransferase family protein n=1 Tax=Campylobacter armoricus TaxID=2505970 RepID=UPI001F2D9B30|nr:formyltransferase family protein [Campylobacter armoricus]